MSRLIKPPIEGRKILWVGRFPQPQTGGTRNRQTFRLKAGLRTRKIRLVSLRKIFLPIKFSYPTFRGSAPMASTRSIPSARASSTGFPTNTPTNKTAGRGQHDFMGRAQPFADVLSGKKWAVKDGGFCPQHFLPPIFLLALPPSS